MIQSEAAPFIDAPMSDENRQIIAATQSIRRLRSSPFYL
jgi:hypothetical protein